MGGTPLIPHAPRAFNGLAVARQLSARLKCLEVLVGCHQHRLGCPIQQNPQSMLYSCKARHSTSLSSLVYTWRLSASPPLSDCCMSHLTLAILVCVLSGGGRITATAKTMRRTWLLTACCTTSAATCHAPHLGPSSSQSQRWWQHPQRQQVQQQVLQGRQQKRSKAGQLTARGHLLKGGGGLRLVGLAVWLFPGGGFACSCKLTCQARFVYSVDRVC